MVLTHTHTLVKFHMSQPEKHWFESPAETSGSHIQDSFLCQCLFTNCTKTNTDTENEQRHRHRQTAHYYISTTP